MKMHHKIIEFEQNLKHTYYLDKNKKIAKFNKRKDCVWKKIDFYQN